MNQKKEKVMNKLAKGGIAGLAAWLFGGGLISALIIFVLVYWIL